MPLSASPIHPRLGSSELGETRSLAVPVGVPSCTHAERRLAAFTTTRRQRSPDYGQFAAKSALASAMQSAARLAAVACRVRVDRSDSAAVIQAENAEQSLVKYGFQPQLQSLSRSVSGTQYAVAPSRASLPVQLQRVPSASQCGAKRAYTGWMTTGPGKQSSESAQSESEVQGGRTQPFESSWDETRPQPVSRQVPALSQVVSGARSPQTANSFVAEPPPVPAFAPPPVVAGALPPVAPPGSPPEPIAPPVDVPPVDAPPLPPVLSAADPPSPESPHAHAQRLGA